MNFEVEPISDTTFGARVTGLKLATIDEATFADLYQTWLAHALLIFPGQHLSNDEQTAFARRVGELEFDLIAISSVRKDGTARPEDDDIIQLLKGNYGWHHDSTYVPVQAKGAVFTAHVVPSRGGATGWADMRAACDGLDETLCERIATRGSNSNRTESNELRKVLKEQEILVSLSVRLENVRFCDCPVGSLKRAKHRAKMLQNSS